MPPLDAARLRELAEGATPGPWVDDDGVIQGATMRPVIIDPSVLRPDIALIVYLANHRDQILAAVRGMEALDKWAVPPDLCDSTGGAAVGIDWKGQPAIVKALAEWRAGR